MGSVGSLRSRSVSPAARVNLATATTCFSLATPARFGCPTAPVFPGAIRNDRLARTRCRGRVGPAGTGTGI